MSEQLASGSRSHDQEQQCHEEHKVNQFMGLGAQLITLIISRNVRSLGSEDPVIIETPESKTGVP